MSLFVEPLGDDEVPLDAPVLPVPLVLDEPGIEDEDDEEGDVEAEPLIEPEALPLAEGEVEVSVVEPVVPGAVVEEEDEGDVPVVDELGDVLVVVLVVELVEARSRSQPARAAEASAIAATTGMSLFMNFSNQDS